MKARIPLNNSLKRGIEREIRKEQNEATRRMIKVFLVTLNTNFNFGKKRLEKVMDDFYKLLLEGRKDEIFWEHIDRVLIDNLKLKLEREMLDVSGNFSVRDSNVSDIFKC